MMGLIELPGWRWVIFTGKMMLYIKNVKALNELIENLSKIDQMEKIERIAPEIN